MAGSGIGTSKVRSRRARVVATGMPRVAPPAHRPHRESSVTWVDDMGSVTVLDCAIPSTGDRLGPHRHLGGGLRRSCLRSRPWQADLRWRSRAGLDVVIACAGRDRRGPVSPWAAERGAPRPRALARVPRRAHVEQAWALAPPRRTVADRGSVVQERHDRERRARAECDPPRRCRDRAGSQLLSIPAITGRRRPCTPRRRHRRSSPPGVAAGVEDVLEHEERMPKLDHVAVRHYAAVDPHTLPEGSVLAARSSR